MPSPDIPASTAEALRLLFLDPLQIRLDRVSRRVRHDLRAGLESGVRSRFIDPFAAPEPFDSDKLR
jgi:hypothetical protein